MFCLFRHLVITSFVYFVHISINVPSESEPMVPTNRFQHTDFLPFEHIMNNPVLYCDSIDVNKFNKKKKIFLLNPLNIQQHIKLIIPFCDPYGQRYNIDTTTQNHCTQDVHMT